MTDRDDRTQEKSSDELRLEIAETRAKVAEDVEALGNKLSKENLSYEAKQAVKDKVRHGAELVRHQVEDTGRRAYRGVRANAIPIALIGIGVGWLAWSSRQQRRHRAGFEGRYGGRYAYSGRPRYEEGYPNESYPYEEGYPYEGIEGEPGFGERAGERVAGVAERAKERGADLAEKARERAHEVGHEVRERAIQVKDQTAKQARYVGGQARKQAIWARGQAEHVWHENPLAVGALALAAGVGVGLLIPSTHTEDHWMGDVRDRLFDRMREKAREGAQVVTESAKHAAEAAKFSARKEAEQRGLIPGANPRSPGAESKVEPHTTYGHVAGKSGPPPAGTQQRTQPIQAQPSPPHTQAIQPKAVSVHEVKPVGEQQTQVQAQEKPPITQPRPPNNGGRI